jgi:hypothetical protein
MQKRLALCAFGILTLGLMPPADAAVPTTVGIQGRLMTAAGGPVADGKYTVTFRLYGSPNAAQASWSETAVGLDVSAGAWKYALGTAQPLDPGVVEASKGGWLGLQVGNEAELSRTAVQSAPFALRAQVAEGLQCSGCVSAAMIDPGALAGYAKSSDLGAYAKTAELGEYVKASALAKVAATGQYGDLLGLPVLAKVGTACGSGLLVQGIKADGSLDCGPVVIKGGKCDVGQVVTEVKADGGVVCGKPTVLGGKCELGKVVSEVKPDGSVVCAANDAPSCTLDSSSPGVATLKCGGKTAIFSGLLRPIKSFQVSPEFIAVDLLGRVGRGPYSIFGPQGEGLETASAGGGVLVATTAEKKVVAWDFTGAAANDPCGLGKVPSGEYDRVQLSHSGDYACAWNSQSGSLACWGKYRVPGYTTYTFCGTNYLPIAAPSNSIIAVGIGPHNVCVVDTSGALKCAGTSTTKINLPPQGTFKDVVLGAYSACAIQTNGVSVCWGSTDSGGVNKIGQMPSGQYSSLVTDSSNYCGLKTDKTIACMGSQVAPSGLFDMVISSSKSSFAVCGIAIGGPSDCVKSSGIHYSFNSPATAKQIAATGTDVYFLQEDGALMKIYLSSPGTNHFEPVQYIDKEGWVF